MISGIIYPGQYIEVFHMNTRKTYKSLKETEEDLSVINTIDAVIAYSENHPFPSDSAEKFVDLYKKRGSMIITQDVIRRVEITLNKERFDVEKRKIEHSRIFNYLFQPRIHMFYTRLSGTMQQLLLKSIIWQMRI